MPTPVMTPLDLRQVSTSERDTLIFERFAQLQPGQALELINDQDPQALNSQFQTHAAGQFNWSYLEQGPAVWRVALGKTAKAAGTSCCGGCCGG